MQALEKWRTKLAWQMALATVVLLAVAGAMAEEVWFFRAKFLANPLGMLFPTVGMAFGVIACFSMACLCVSVIVRTQKHATQMRALEERRRNNPQLVSLEPLSPEQKEQLREKLIQQFQSAPPKVRGQMEALMRETLQEGAQKIRAGRGSTPEVEASIAETEELWQQVSEGLKAQRLNDAVPRGEVPARQSFPMGLLMQSPPVVLANQSFQTWASARIRQGGGPGKAVALCFELFGRITAASPNERSLRLMPALNMTLTFFAFGLILGAVEHGRHTHEAVVFSITTVGLWVFHLRERLMFRHGDTAWSGLSWEMEWGLGIAITALIVSLSMDLLSPSKHHAAVHSSHLLPLLAVTIVALWLAALVLWWVQIIRDLLIPRPRTTRETT